MTYLIELGNVGSRQLFGRTIVERVHDRLRIGNMLEPEGMAEFVRDHAMEPQQRIIFINVDRLATYTALKESFFEFAPRRRADLVILGDLEVERADELIDLISKRVERVGLRVER